MRTGAYEKGESQLRELIEVRRRLEAQNAAAMTALEEGSAREERLELQVEALRRQVAEFETFKELWIANYKVEASNELTEALEQAKQAEAGRAAAESRVVDLENALALLRSQFGLEAEKTRIALAKQARDDRTPAT